LDVAISVPDEPIQYFTAIALGKAPESEDETSQSFAELISEGSRFITITPLGPKPPKRDENVGPHTLSWEVTLTEGRDGANGNKPSDFDYLDAVTKLGEVDEVALVAVPGLYEDLEDGSDAVEQQREVLLILIQQAEDLRDRLVLVDVSYRSRTTQRTK
jgi:hypothetical protein